MNTDNFVTVQEAAQQLGVTDSAIRFAIAKKRLDAQTAYGRRLIAKTDLEAYRIRTQPNGIKNTGRPRKQPSLSSDTARLFAEANRHIWDTPEEDAAWQHLQEEI